MKKTDSPKPLLIYIAGPYTSVTHDANGAPQPHYPVAHNVSLAAETAHTVIDRFAHVGAFPVTPHLNTAFFEEVHSEIPAEYWLNGTREMMLRCDAVILINHPALETSAGTRAEVVAALDACIPVYPSIEDALMHLTSSTDGNHDFAPMIFDKQCDTTTRRVDYLIRRAQGSVV